MNQSIQIGRPLFAAFLLMGLAAGDAEAGLIHRYSFSDGVKDSVGKVDGKLKGGATIADGKLVLKNETNGSSASDDIQHVAFDASILPSPANSVTFVMWFTAKDVGAFSRLLNISAKDGSEGSAFFYLSPRTADGMSRAAISATDTGARIPVDNPGLDDGNPHMIAVVINGTTKKMHVFIDGKESAKAEDLGENTLDKVKPVHNYIGRSTFDADPGLNGSIDEFRVYDTPLSADEIAAIAKAGPGTVPPATQPGR